MGAGEMSLTPPASPASPLVAAFLGGMVIQVFVAAEFEWGKGPRLAGFVW